MNFETESKMSLEAITKLSWDIAGRVRVIVSYCKGLNEKQEEVIKEQAVQQKTNNEILKLIIAMGEQMEHQEASAKERFEKLEKIIIAQEDTIMSLTSRLDRNL
jgi:hypothetical protein